MDWNVGQHLAVLSDAVYKSGFAPPGYRVIDSVSSASGFQGAAYLHQKTGQVFVVYRGTDSPLGADGYADLGIGAYLGRRALFTARVHDPLRII